ncbi:hypothetical protein [Flavobacterium cerinum]|uniref:Uncharacterized protein n=1 Tax=Flavobacterium cerinum TaxID=2502784 RepID=A0ABY5IS08_9FLAO|nr:hypothetical protein [Flavobacterium cerinum]UUC44568.1 hypothetical protein NOX80_13110 [Flavobacterium cerinum]
MASCFITFKDGRCYSRRWTIYDAILHIAIQELERIPGGMPLSEWLKLQIPVEEAEHQSDACYGFYNSRIDEWKNRELDVRSLTPENQELFWEAIRNGRIRLVEEGEAYSPLNIDYFDEFYTMYELAEKGEPPMDYNHLIIVAEPCKEKNGPGW